MNETKWIKERHSVRQYIDRPLGKEIISKLQHEIDKCNVESGLHIQLVTNEPKAFDSFLARYGHFKGVKNYFALIGKKDEHLEELCGYYGERLVLLAQKLGLNTCWVVTTYSKIKTAFTLDKGEKLCVVIAVGYGETQGVSHKSKSVSEVSKAGKSVPDWFKNGVDMALLAPTALNQQKFKFSLEGNQVTVDAGRGLYTKIDLGIVKYHFEVGAGKENFIWK